MLKAYKYRIYPNKVQQARIENTFGCCRFVYNQTLAYRKDMYEQEKKQLTRTDCNNYCNRQLKSQYPWLKDVDKFALTNAVYNMDMAFVKFFTEHQGFPRFKSRHDSRMSYKTNFTNNNIALDFENDRIKLPKLKWVKASLHRTFTGQIKSVSVLREPSGKYYASVIFETEHTPLPSTEGSVGIDMGIDELCVTSDGRTFGTPESIARDKAKIPKLQRELSRRQKGSANYEKTRKKLARIYEKISNTRLDNIHKATHEIVSENQVIISEDIKVSELLKDSEMAKSMGDASWYEMHRQLDYKAKWNGRTYIKVGSQDDENVCRTHGGDVEKAQEILEAGAEMLQNFYSPCDM